MPVAHVAVARAELDTALTTFLWPRPVHLVVDAAYVLRGHEAVWVIWQRALEYRGVASLRLSKVKGHATDDDVETGRYEALDKSGIDAADEEVATVGVDCHHAACRAFAATAGDRHTAYRKFVARVQKFFLAVLMETTCLVRQRHGARRAPLPPSGGGPRRW